MWKRVSLLWMLVKGDARRLWFALRHPDAPAWLKAGWHVALAYVIGFFIMLAVVGWHPHTPHKEGGPAAASVRVAPAQSAL